MKYSGQLEFLKNYLSAMDRIMDPTGIIRDLKEVSWKAKISSTDRAYNRNTFYADNNGQSHNGTEPKLSRVVYNDPTGVNHMRLK